jgi:hypothetical protein
LIKAGKTLVLLNIEGQGIVNRMWVTFDDRSPEMLRSLKIEMFWDGQKKPAVSAPLGDFFGVGLGQAVPFENELFANPEGRSFNFFIPMPFKTGARIQITNESNKDLNLIFFDINYQRLTSWDDSYLYFHTYWSRDTATTLGKDFEILPKVEGKGRFLGTNIGVNSNPDYKDYWFGEGEVKMYLNGDTDYASLVGTGTEDYIGTAWGQGEFSTRYTGCLTSKNYQWTFYRYHIPDPIYFKTDLKVVIQQMGGAMKEQVIEMLDNGVELLPVTIAAGGGLVHIYHEDGKVDLKNPELPDGWTNYYRSDDVSATSYFYLDKPVSKLPAIQSVDIRAVALKKAE